MKIIFWTYLLVSIQNSLALPLLSNAAEVKLDAIVTLYPDHRDKNLFYFFPSQSKVASNQNGDYRFSLGHWNLNTADLNDGGGFLHVMFNNVLANDQIEAMDEFRNKRKKKKLPTKYAPLPIQRTWIAPKEERVKLYVDTEVPPHGSVIEGNIAFSATLTEVGSKYIKSSIERGAEGLQVSYCINVQGLSHSLDAEVTADWKSVYTYLRGKFGGKIWIFSTELERVVEKMRSNQIIRISTNGGDQKDRAYVKSIADRIEKKFFKTADKISTSKDAKGGTGYKITLKSAKSVNSFHLDFQVQDRIKMNIDLCNPLGLSGLARNSDEYIFNIND